jgi:hypothetical protein
MKLVDVLACVGFFAVIWLSSGMIGAWRFHQGHVKEMDIVYKKQINEKDRSDGEMILSLLIFYFVSCLGGFFTLYTFEKDGKYNCWYHRSSSK